MKYIKYKDFKGKLEKDECLLIDANTYLALYKNSDALNGIPVAITPDGEEPEEIEENAEVYNGR